MKKLILTGLAAISLVACSGSFQNNATKPETILRSKFNQSMPEWITGGEKFIEENDKLYFVSEIVRDEKSNNTSHLEDLAELHAASGIAQMVTRNLNRSIQSAQNSSDLKSVTSSAKEVSESSVRISSIVPVNSYWQLIETYDGKKEYHAFAKVRVDSQEIKDAMERALISSNPNMDKSAAKAIVNQASEMNLGSVKPNDKIF